MSATDLAAIHAELSRITFILYVVGALTFLAVALACFRTYQVVKQHVSRFDPFASEASDLIEKGELDKLIQLASAKIRERPNHAYAHWYLARALYYQDRFAAAIEEFSTIRKLQPEWAVNYIDPYVQEAKQRLESMPKEKV